MGWVRPDNRKAVETWRYGGSEGRHLRQIRCRLPKIAQISELMEVPTWHRHLEQTCWKLLLTLRSPAKVGDRFRGCIMPMQTAANCRGDPADEVPVIDMEELCLILGRCDFIEFRRYP